MLMKMWFNRWPGEWQFEFLIWRLQVRIGNQQQAIWWCKGPKNLEYIWLLNAGKRARAIRKQFGG